MSGAPGQDPGEPPVEDLAAQELHRIQATARMLLLGDTEPLRGAMLIVATESGVHTTPYVDPEEDPREMSLWMLGAFMAHIADSAPGEMHPMEAAQHAAMLMNDHTPDDREGEEDV